jgi:hypothetical protein
MLHLGVLLLLAGVAFAHFGLKSVTVDGTMQVFLFTFSKDRSDSSADTHHSIVA